MDNYLEDLDFLNDCSFFLAGMIFEKEMDATKSRRGNWVNPYLAERNTKGRFITDFENLTKSPQLFLENFRMSPEMFEELFHLVEPFIRRKRNSRPKDFIPERAKLAIVLEFMASGDLQRHISSCYRISKQHFSRIIVSVCNAICHVLKDQVPKWDAQTLAEVACGFREKWNFPNCVGAMDGKHICIKAPPNSGSIFYNYKGYHSIVLLAVCDADYRFTYLDVEAYGSEGDSGIFMQSAFGRSIINENCSFPADALIGNVRLPFFLVGDDAFPQTKRIMKPFSKKNLTRDEAIFNYRLSRARRCIENAFGILSARWACLRKVLFCSPDSAQKITTACCLLHNWLINISRTTYCPDVFSGSESDGVWVQGAWEMQDTQEEANDFSSLISRRGRTTDYGKYMRNILMEYVNSPEGSVPWQNEVAFL